MLGLVMDITVRWPQWIGLTVSRRQVLAGRRSPGAMQVHCRQHFYRNALLFDRFLAFDVRLEQSETADH